MATGGAKPRLLLCPAALAVHLIEGIELVQITTPSPAANMSDYSCAGDPSSVRRTQANSVNLENEKCKNNAKTTTKSKSITNANPRHKK